MQVNKNKYQRTILNGQVIYYPVLEDLEKETSETSPLVEDLDILEGYRSCGKLVFEGSSPKLDHKEEIEVITKIFEDLLLYRKLYNFNNHTLYKIGQDREDIKIILDGDFINIRIPNIYPFVGVNPVNKLPEYTS